MGNHNGTVNNETRGTISGGTFKGTVSGGGTINDNAKVTVTFNSDGWTGTQKVLKGQKASAPTRDGYTCTGCYITEGCTGDAFDFASVTITNDITLYARFTPNTYTISYNAGQYGSGSAATGTKVHGVPLTLKSTPYARTGYTQTGWATSDGGEKVYDLGGSYTTDAAVTLYPVWTSNRYTIIIKPENGDADITITQDYNTPVTAPILTRDGYAFDGWDKTFPNTMPAENMIITAKWKDIPEIIDGKGQSLIAGETRELTFRSNAAYNDFIRVELDGETVDEKNYTVKEGSTIVTLNAEYVATLSAGKHTLGIVSESGTATTAFTINNVKAENNNTSPKTDDNSHMALWFELLFVSGGALAGTELAYGKKKKQSAK